MLDDTKELVPNNDGNAVPRPPIRLSENVAEILKTKITRAHATQWANDLRYLTFDDEDYYDSGHDMRAGNWNENMLHGQCQRCQQRVPVPPSHECNNTMCGSGGGKEREMELHSYGNPCIHLREHSCATCYHVPRFPDGTVTRFRIRRLQRNNKNSDCDHFVAVSYCWSSSKDTAEDQTRYKVVEEDGTVRDARASKSTIDRSVAFARENGFRMIWIDQECIEQNDPYKHELAIQAMDHVFLRAYTTIGLLHAELQDRHLECLSFVYEYQMHRRRGDRHSRGRILTNMIDAVDLILKDRWNTRAWILQEAFSASGRMVLLFPKVAQVDSSQRQLICHQLSLSEVAISIDTLRHCLQICESIIRGSLLPPTNTDTLVSRPKRSSNKAVGKASMRPSVDAAKILDLLQLFYPESIEHDVVVWANTSKPRRTCSAATALSFLQPRDLERVPDKLAIVANLCDFHLRFNTKELEKTQESLATCMLVLTLSNGDFSLLTPELYRSLPETKAIECPADVDSEFSWLYSLPQKTMHQIHSNIWNPYGHTAGTNSVTPVRLSEGGLAFPGTLWNVNRFIELPTLQIKHADGWRRLCRQDRLSVSFHRTMRLATTHLLFEIIQHLVRVGETQVADSVLNSTSNWRWLKGPNKECGDMVESVKQFPPGLRVEHRKGMFSLDPSPDGRYHQCWIIDRVMENGGFWAGGIVDAVAVDTTGQEAKISITETGTISPDANTSSFDLQDISNRESREEEIRLNSYEEFSHSRLMAMRSMLTMLFDLRSPSEEADDAENQSQDESEDIKLFKLDFPRVGGLFGIGLRVSQLDGAKEDIQTRCAVFDVDGSADDDTLVLLPYQTTLESIPRPAMRSLSVSWAVEPLPMGQGIKANSTEGRPRRFRARSMTKGMWRFVSIPSGRYKIV